MSHSLAWAGRNWKALGSMAVAGIGMLFALDARLDAHEGAIEHNRNEAAAERVEIRRDVDKIMDDVGLIRCIVVSDLQGGEPLACLTDR